MGCGLVHISEQHGSELNLSHSATTSSKNRTHTSPSEPRGVVLRCDAGAPAPGRRGGCRLGPGRARWEARGGRQGEGGEVCGSLWERGLGAATSAVFAKV